MAHSTPKQFLEIDGCPIILKTIECFTAIYPDIEIILVLQKAGMKLWDKLKYKGKIKLALGGENRFYSVKNGLEIATGDVIAIHDAVRPFVAKNVIKKAFEQAEVSGAVMPVISVKESLRKITFDESEPLPKGGIRIVQTPQVFKASVIKMAYEQKYHLYFSDDATVVEEAGHDIILIEGNEENIKITTPFDMKLGTFLSNQL
jgi:2-C-methyl-D-erythritol 4-phosphate cytidylyltransferase